MARPTLLLTPLVLLLFASVSGLADVQPKTGTFTLQHEDFTYSGGLEPRITRYYSSTRQRSGIFGPGWAIQYENSLRVVPEGVVIDDYGADQPYLFTPDTESPDYVPMMVAAIVRAAKQNKDIGQTHNDESQLIASTTTTETIRLDNWEKYRKLNLVSNLDLPLRSNYCGCQRLKWSNGEYRREVRENTETFNSTGKLTRISDRKNNWIQLTYDIDGRLSRITDNFKRVIRFYLSPKGLVEKIEGSQDRESRYYYGERGELIESKNSNGEKFKYAYDFSNKLTRVTEDKTTLEIAYYSRDLEGRVKLFKDRDDIVSSYTYETVEPLHILVKVEEAGEDGKLIFKSTYEYFSEKNEKGDEITVRKIETIDEDKIEIIYFRQTGFPRSIRRGGEEVTFEYDPDGQVTRKTTPYLVTELKYDKKTMKVSRVQTYRPTDPKEITWSEFQYDSIGNLVRATNSKGRNVSLKYDFFGRIEELRENKSTIQFVYNEDSKPIKITDPLVGSITVSYKKNGEIDKVDSRGGRKVSLKVITAFQTLMELIRPAGVSFSF